MISGKAVEAAARAHDAEDAAQRGEPDPWSIEGDDFAYFRADRIAAMRAALSAALPLLLEGKRKEIARMIDPPFWEDLDETVKWLEGQGGKYEAGWPRFRFLKRELAHVMALYDRSDRIIAMLGRGE